MVAFPFLVVRFPVYRCRPVELPLPSGRATTAVRQSKESSFQDGHTMISEQNDKQSSLFALLRRSR